MGLPFDDRGLWFRNNARTHFEELRGEITSSHFHQILDTIKNLF